MRATTWTNYKLPFGGFKQSGLGRELGENALEGCLEEKAIHINLGLPETVNGCLSVISP